MPSVYGCDHPKARKEHKCCECRGVIPIGEVYNKHHGIWDGSASTFKVCVDCDLLRVEIDKDMRNTEDQTAFEYLSESVFDSDEHELIKRFLNIKRQRGAEIKDWMKDRESDSSRPIYEVNQTPASDGLNTEQNPCAGSESDNGETGGGILK